MNRLSLILIFYFLATITSCTHPIKPIARDIAALKSSGKVAGVWILQGTSSTRGPYNGELELRPSHDGTYDVVRMVTYINYFYDGLRVQEVWTGKAIPDTDTLTISYDLYQGEFITKLGDLTKTIQDLQNPITVTMRFLPTPAGLATQFSDKKVSEYSEWITTSRPLDAQPLFKKEGYLISAQGAQVPTSEKKKIQNAQKLLAYAKDPFVQSYKNRPEFKAELVEVIHEGADLEFIRHNRDVLRIVNKVTDDATIAESVLKQTSYMPTLQEKAARYEDFLVKQNFSPVNLVVVRKFETNSFKAFSQDTDAAFTTGMYLASQAMRYQMTKEPQALTNMRQAIRGLRGLTEISKGSPMLAVAIASTLPNLPKGWSQGSGPYQDLIWTKGDQRLAALGILHGLTWLALTAPKTETDLWMNLSMILKELNFKDTSTWSPLTVGTLKGLNALILNDEAAKKDFMARVPPEKSFYWAGNANWIADFENTLEVVNHIQLSDALGIKNSAEVWRKYLAEEWKILSAARRTLRSFVTYGFGPSRTLPDLKDGVEAGARSLSEIPYPRPHMDVRIDNSGDPNWVLSPIPRNYWTVSKKALKPVVDYYQGLRQLPLYKLQAVTSPFIWKEDAFQYQGRGNKDLEATGVDYLYAYWLAKVAGVPQVQ